MRKTKKDEKRPKARFPKTRNPRPQTRAILNPFLLTSDFWLLI